MNTLEIANKALMTANKALNSLNSHEKIDSIRYDTIIKGLEKNTIELLYLRRFILSFSGTIIVLLIGIIVKLVLK